MGFGVLITKQIKFSHKMKKDFFTNLPSHITINILSRLPIPTVLQCKSVCKPWLHLLNSQEFVNHHLSESAPGLAVFQFKMRSQLYEIYDLNDKVDLEHHHLNFKRLTTFKLPSHEMIQGSADGLLLLRNQILRPCGLSICNPITREWIAIHSPQEFDHTYPQVVSFGFGVSRITNQYKVVRVFHGQDTYECHVYTLGAGLWTSVAPSPPFVYNCRSTGAFLNGNLHWLVLDFDGKPMISRFDLETEMFHAFSAPPLHHKGGLLIDVFALGDSLCVSDNSSHDEIFIWLMKEYGDDKSWRKEYAIRKSEDLGGDWYEVVRPIKVFKDDTILLSWDDIFLFYSSSKTRTMSKIEMFGGAAVDSLLHTSSFVSLRSFEMENVSYF